MENPTKKLKNNEGQSSSVPQTSEREADKPVVNDMETNWRSLQFFATGEVDVINDISLKFTYDASKEMHFMHLMKLYKREMRDGKEPATFLEWSTLELEDTLEYLENLLVLIGESRKRKSSRLLVCLKGLTSPEDNDAYAEEFWQDPDLVHILSSGRMKLRVFMECKYINCFYFKVYSCIFN
jgi:hypothetical protein